MRLRELQEKNVINMKNCKCLGNVVDLDIDEKDGCIRALILPGPGHFLESSAGNMSCLSPGAMS